MQIRDIMTPNVHIASPSNTLAQAARAMADHDIGFLPVGENDRLVGTVTDRDIAIRAVAEGRDPQTPVSDVMTSNVLYCSENEDVIEIARNFADQQVRRMPVVDNDKRLVGVVSLCDFALDQDLDAETVEALGGISRPGGHHTQTTGPQA